MHNTGAAAGVGSAGDCWSAAPGTSGSATAGNLGFHATDVNPLIGLSRTYGLPVRCVQDKQGADARLRTGFYDERMGARVGNKRGSSLRGTASMRRASESHGTNPGPVPPETPLGGRASARGRLRPGKHKPSGRASAAYSNEPTS